MTRPRSSAPAPPLREKPESPTGQPSAPGALRPWRCAPWVASGMPRPGESGCERAEPRGPLGPAARRAPPEPGAVPGAVWKGAGVGGKALRRERPERQRARLRAARALGQGLPGPLGWRRGASAVYEPVVGCSSSAADQGARDRGSGAPLPPVLLTPPPRRSLLPGLARATRGAQSPSNVAPKAGGAAGHTAQRPPPRAAGLPGRPELPEKGGGGWLLGQQRVAEETAREARGRRGSSLDSQLCLEVWGQGAGVSVARTSRLGNLFPPLSISVHLPVQL